MTLLKRIINLNIFDESGDTFKGGRYLDILTISIYLIGVAAFVGALVIKFSGNNPIPALILAGGCMALNSGFIWQSGLYGRAKNNLLKVAVAIILLYFYSKF